MGSFEEWEEMLDNADVGGHLVDGAGTILWANKSELTTLGYTKEEYFDHSIVDFHADGDVIQCILGILTGGKSLKAYPARLKAKDGSILHVMINSNVYRDGDEFVHTRCFTTPISEVVYEALRKESESRAA